MKPSPAVVDGDLYGFCGLMEPDPKPDPFFEGIGGGLKIDGDRIRKLNVSKVSEPVSESAIGSASDIKTFGKETTEPNVLQSGAYRKTDFQIVVAVSALVDLRVGCSLKERELHLDEREVDADDAGDGGRKTEKRR